jgi:hypothetical protein
MNSRLILPIPLMQCSSNNYLKTLRLVYKPHLRNHAPVNRYRKCNIELNFIRLGESISDITSSKTLDSKT